MRVQLLPINDIETTQKFSTDEISQEISKLESDADGIPILMICKSDENGKYHTHTGSHLTYSALLKMSKADNRYNYLPCIVTTDPREKIASDYLATPDDSKLSYVFNLVERIQKDTGQPWHKIASLVADSYLPLSDHYLRYFTNILRLEDADASARLRELVEAHYIYPKDAAHIASLSHDDRKKFFLQIESKSIFSLLDSIDSSHGTRQIAPILKKTTKLTERFLRPYIRIMTLDDNRQRSSLRSSVLSRDLSVHDAAFVATQKKEQRTFYFECVRQTTPQLAFEDFKTHIEELKKKKK